MKNIRRFLGLGILLAVFALEVQADYLLLQGDPKKGEYPLNTVLQVKFQKDVATVQDAFIFLLQNTPYRFVSPPVTDPASVVMIQPIAEGYREMGPLPLHRILSLLVGVDYQVVLNPETKEISVSRIQAP